ncbi:MAG: ABC transporter ATP-binding protein [Coraliomargarita sp. TMED73]|nr:MAG: ABC transporter ATP-binding protein [Coraliomargarita sp. TMED73]
MVSVKPFLPYYKYLKPVWWQFAFGILFGVLYSVSSGLGLPVMAETVFPILFGNSQEAPRWLQEFVSQWFGDDIEGGFLIVCCLFIPLTMFLRSLGSWGNGYFMTYSGISVVQRLQAEVFTKVQRLPLAFFQRRKTGELNAAIMGYPNQIKRVIVDMSNDLVKQPLTLLSAVGFMIYKSFSSESFFIAAIGVLSIPLLVFPIRRIGRYLAKRAQQLVHKGESLSSWTIESIQSPVETRAYNLESRQILRFVDQLRDIFKLSMKSTRYSLLISPSIEVVASAGLALALFLGVRTGMSEGEFMALGVALYMAYSPVKKIGRIHGQLKQLEAPLNRLESILQAEETVRSPDNPVALPQPLRGEIVFEGVDFEYESGKPVLRDINVTIPAGQSVGLVGASGAGKSTFVSMVLRLYDPTKGRILLDGVDLRELDLEELRASIAYVPQMPLLFNQSVGDNIRVGRLEADQVAVEEAARQANAWEFIRELPDGFDTVLSERGNSLSGGQRQRIAIARAFLKDAPILILDEATSALDKESDQLIQEAVGRLAKDRTTLSISHRMQLSEIIDSKLLFDINKLNIDYQNLR